MKYLYVLRDPATSCVYSFLHVPVDQYIYQAAEQELHIQPVSAAWSRMDNYESYYTYQISIRAALNVAPMDWEFSAWQRMAAVNTQKLE